MEELCKGCVDQPGFLYYWLDNLEQITFYYTVVTSTFEDIIIMQLVPVSISCDVAFLRQLWSTLLIMEFNPQMEMR